MASLVYDKFRQTQVQGSFVNFATDTLKVALLTSSYTPSQTTHQYYSDLTNEVVGTGYTAGGATLASQAVGLDTTNHRAYLTANDTSWASSTITARYAAIYKSTGTGSTSQLVGLIDFGSDKSTTGDTFYIQWPTAGSDGIFYIG